jgi:membrane protein
MPMFAYLRIPIGWRNLIRRTGAEILDDNCFGLAAQLAFYFFLALFPALLVAVSLVGILPIRSAFNEALRNLSTVAPEEVMSLVRHQFEQLSGGAATGKWVIFGVMGALWSSSAAMVAIIGTLNRAYDIEESRPWWQTRIVAILLSIGVAAFIVIAFALLLAGPAVSGWLEQTTGIDGAFRTLWNLLHWPVVIALVVLVMDMIYFFAPDAKTRWVWITPGSLLATALWIVTSSAFKFYVARFSNYNATYGAIGGIIILMLWFYLSGLSILIGAELNSEIDRAIAEQDGPVQPRPGEKKTIGPVLEGSR